MPETRCGAVGAGAGRRSRSGRLAAGLIAAAGVLGAAGGAAACPCRPDPPAEELAGADAVFQGRVLRTSGSWLERHPDLRRAVRRTLPEWLVGSLLRSATTYRFEVQAAWKGVETTRISVVEHYGVELDEGETYLVYAKRDEGALTTAWCSRTRPLVHAAADLAVLGPPTIALRRPPSTWAFAGVAAAVPLAGGAGLLARAARRRRREGTPKRP